MGTGRRTVDRPFISIWFAGSLAEDATHLADLLHGAVQVLHQVVFHVCYLQMECGFLSFGLLRALVSVLQSGSLNSAISCLPRLSVKVL